MITGAGLLATHAAKVLIDAGETVVFYDVAPSEAYIRLVLEDRPYALERGDVLDLPQMLHVIDRHRVTGTVQAAAQKAMADSKVGSRILDLGMLPIASSEGYDAIMKSEIDKFGQAVRTLGLKID